MTEDSLNNSTLDQFIDSSREESCEDSSSMTPNETSESVSNQCSTVSTPSAESQETGTEIVSADTKDSQHPRLQTESPIVTECLHDISGSRVSEGVAKNYSSSVRLFLESLEEVDIESADISDVWNHLKERASKGKSQQTVSNDLSAIKKVYNWINLETERETKVNYLELNAINISQLQFPDPIQREPLDADELDLLYENMRCYRDRLMTTVAAETGARNTDLRKITLSRVDVESDEPQIELTNTKVGGIYTIDISQTLATEIQFFIDYKRPAYPSYNSSDYLFLSRDGGKLSTKQFNRIVKRAAKKAGIQEIIGTRVHRQNGESVEQKVHRVTPHALRHTFNNMLEKEGVPVEYRAKALGQDSIETNQKHYSHEDSDYRKYVKQLHRD